MHFFLELFPNDGDDDHDDDDDDDDDDVKDRSRPVVSESIEAERGNLLLSPPSIWDQTVTNEPKIKNKNLVKFLNYDGQGGN